MAKIKAEDIYKHYTSEKFKPMLPSRTGFRHFRFKLADKGWRKVKVKIHKQDDLIKWIIKLGGCDIYYSTSQWLNPHKISSRGGSGTYHIADNLLLNNDLVFDIDAEEPITITSLDKARKSTSNIFETMKEFSDRYELEYCAVTGHKGFRLAYKDKSLVIPENPRKRLDAVEKDRKLFIDKLHSTIKDNKSNPKIYKVDTVFDEKITTNVMCVVRVIGTVHSSTGYISSILPTSSLRKNITKILDRVPYVGKERPVIPKREMKKDDAKSYPRPRLLQLADDVAGLASLSFRSDTHAYFITNKVLGVKKGFIPIFIYQDCQHYYKKELEVLQEKYKLGNLYVFQSERNKVVLSLKTMQRRQLQKVLNQSSSRTKHDFRKYRRIFAPFLMAPIEKMKNKFTGRLSLGHFHYVKPCTIPRLKVYCGWPQIEIVRANVEQKNMVK